MTKSNKDQENGIINLVLNSVSELSEQQKVEIKTDKKGELKPSLGFKRKIDTKKIARENKLIELRSIALKQGISPVSLIMEWELRCEMARQKELDYAKFIKRGGVRKAFIGPVDERLPQLMPYTSDNKRFFFNKYLKPRFLSRNKVFLVDNYNRMIIDEMFKYFIRDRSCKLDLTKGLFLCGQVGTGKTELVMAFSEFTKDQMFPNSFDMAYMDEINLEIAKNGLVAVGSYNQGDFCFDDIAIRETKIKSFGTDIMPSDEIMRIRYKRFSKKKTRPTHYTSNIDFNPEEEEDYLKLLKVYDKRSIDRIQEKCNFIYLGGPSRRGKRK